MDFLFDHPFATALILTVVLGVPLAIVGGRRTNALLEALRARFGGEIVRRRISPSELRITSDERILSFSSFLGSTSSSGAQSPASVYVRVYFVRWKREVPDFALRRRSRRLDFSRSLGIERRRELMTGDAEFDEEYCVFGECENVVPYLLAIKQDLLALQQIAGPNDVRLGLSRETPPQENRWRRGDPILRVLGDEEVDGSKVACLTLHVDGKALRSEAESTCILAAAQRFAVALEPLGVERA